MNPILVLFPLFLITNALLSYASLSGGLKSGLFLVGILLPWIWGLRQKGLTVAASGTGKDLPGPGWTAFLLLGAAAVAGRFVQLTTLLVWPNFDESSVCFDAFHLAAGAPPRFFYGISQAPPLFIWALGLWFKAVGCSLATLRIFPALVSLTAVPLAYAAARTLWSRSRSFLAAALVGASFWPVFLGRFTLMTNLILPFECLALWALGSFYQAKNPASRARSALALGLVWGLGIYTHLHWPIVVAVTLLPFAARLWEKRKDPAFGSGRAAALGLLTASVVAAPLFVEAYRERYGAYLAHLSLFHKDFSWARQFDVWLSCFTAPFWGIDPDVHTYQPVWGGFLNPVLTSLFFLGLLSLTRRGAPPFHRWVLTSLGLCFLPGLLTQDQETFRLFPMLPFLIVGILLGAAALGEAIRPDRRLVLGWVLAAGSLALDGHHLFGAFHRVWDDPKTWASYTKSLGRYHAYGILEDWRRGQGPGCVFPDFVQGLPDQSLAVATYDFNALLNPALDPAQARWAAVLANVNYQPFLKERFPHGHAYALSQELPAQDGGWMLFVFPTSDMTPKTLARWTRAQRDLEPFLDRHLCYVMGGSMAGDIEALRAIQGSFQGDPFLRAAYWEKLADLWIKGGFGRQVPLDAVESLEKAAREGYPAAHLYERIGVLRLMRGEPDAARQAFERAQRCPLDLTDSKDLLRSIPKNGR